MKNRYSLYCLAPDGEFVREGDFTSIEAAWRRSEDMGSRWIFYPVRIVAGASGKRSRIVDVPHGMPEEWKGRALATLCKVFSSDPDHACDYVNGKAPFCIFP